MKAHREIAKHCIVILSMTQRLRACSVLLSFLLISTTSYMFSVIAIHRAIQLSLSPALPPPLSLSLSPSLSRLSHLSLSLHISLSPLSSHPLSLSLSLPSPLSLSPPPLSLSRLAPWGCWVWRVVNLVELESWHTLFFCLSAARLFFSPSVYLSFLSLSSSRKTVSWKTTCWWANSLSLSLYSKVNPLKWASIKTSHTLTLCFFNKDCVYHFDRLVVNVNFPQMYNVL